MSGTTSTTDTTSATSSTDLTRRRLLQGAAVALTAATASVALSLSRPTATRSSAAGPQASDTFDEVFQGRRIQGRPLPTGSATGHSATGHHHGGAGYLVRIDDQELHLMRNADGTWISVINHYQTFSTPRALARAAVHGLRGAALVPLAA
ncbi:tyrosinase cofactor [Kitasatospora nipponensis]|uniref:Tyrosinase cofactor n=1 Tax=Kitasatospora nipponensis TaxID=258049 RepID=A0ABN1WYH2_9ACTN